MSTLLRAALAALSLSLLAACSHTGAYNQAYLAAARKPDASVPGKVLVVTSPADDAYVYTGKPTSFTGGATSITLPLGVIVREAALAAANDTFAGGATAAASAENAKGYSYVITPKLLGFSYEYNQLKNVGFAITPTAVVSLRITALDAAGKPVWSRELASGAVEGPAYMINTSPQEEISKVAHRAVYETLMKGTRAMSAEFKPAGQ